MILLFSYELKEWKGTAWRIFKCFNIVGPYWNQMDVGSNYEVRGWLWLWSQRSDPSFSLRVHCASMTPPSPTIADSTLTKCDGLVDLNPGLDLFRNSLINKSSLNPSSTNYIDLNRGWLQHFEPKCINKPTKLTIDRMLCNGLIQALFAWDNSPLTSLNVHQSHSDGDYN